MFYGYPVSECTIRRDEEREQQAMYASQLRHIDDGFTRCDMCGEMLTADCFSDEEAVCTECLNSAGDQFKEAIHGADVPS